MPEKNERGRDSFMEEIDIPSFQDFLTEQGISPEDEKIPLLRKIWNVAITAACDYFGNQEGTDYGASEALLVPDSEKDD
ncbi:MAG: hypothetical protein WC242_03945 [Candidatus Paceibacterota bacterium]|jgi:hypothetical protein